MLSKALIIDDDSSSRKLAKYFLEKLGLKATEAPDGELGSLDILNQNQDLLVLDWRMPRLTGGDTLVLVDSILKKISNPYSEHPIPTILYTSTELSELELPETKHFRFKGYIHKKWPIEIQKRHFNRIMRSLKKDVA